MFAEVEICALQQGISEVAEQLMWPEQVTLSKYGISLP
jgi:hypothetical protein